MLDPQAFDWNKGSFKSIIWILYLLAYLLNAFDIFYINWWMLWEMLFCFTFS